jgi:hypothetical protein
MAAGIVVAALILVTPGIPPASAATTCPTVFFMGARGSGEPAGFGAVISHVDTQFKAQIGTAATVEDFAIPYPAIAITLPQLGGYPSSVQAGADSAVSFIQQMNGICPKSVFVLAGWSQGADVVASTMYQVAGFPDLEARVVGATLFGDPQFNPNSAADVSGTTTGLQGVFGSRPEFPSSSVNRIHSYCRDGDAVCNYEPAGFAKFLLGKGPHFGYVNPGPESQLAADFLAQQVFQPDLAVAVDPPAGAAPSGGQASFGVRVRNAGALVSPAPVTVQLGAGGQTDGTITASGTG